MLSFLGTLIAAIMAALSRLFGSRLGGWVGTAMVALGIAWVTNEAVVEPAMQDALNALSGMHAVALQWVLVANWDKYITIVLSAYAAGGIKRAILVRRR